MFKLKKLLQAAAATMVVASLGSVEGTAQAAPTTDAPVVVDTSREPMGEILRGSIIRNGDVDAMIEVVQTCKTYGSDFRKDTSAWAVDRLHDEMYKVEQRHWRRVQMKRNGGMFYFRDFPDGYVPPKDPISLTCQAITGIPVPARASDISRAFYAERVQKWRTAAYAERHPKEEAPMVVVSVTPPKEDKPADTKAGEVPPPKATVTGPKAGDMAGMPVVNAKTIGKCEPSTFAVKSKTDEELVLKVRPGANYWQLKDSCWAEKYETKASEVILANKAEVTIPYCTAKPNTLPAKKDFDPKRWNLGKKGALKIGDAANKEFVESCSEEGRLGYALQAGQELHLSKKVDPAAKAAEEAQKAAEAAEAKKAEEAKAAEEAKKVAEKKAADEADAAKKAEEAKVASGVDAGKPADADSKPADSAKVDGAGGAVPADSSFRVDQAGSAQGPPAPNPTANGPPNTL